jgi:uncharacterized protein (TIGR02246 family)
MTSQLRRSFAVAFCVLCGCTPGETEPTDTTQEDLQALAELIRQHVEAVRSENLAAVMAQETDDIWYLGPDAPPIFGKAALEAALGPLYQQYDLEVEMTTQDVRVIGDWAFEWGTGSNRLTPLESGETLRNPDMKYFYLYQRQADGGWKIAVTMYNNNSPPLPPS